MQIKLSKTYATLLIALILMVPLLAPMSAFATITNRPLVYKVDQYTVQPDGTLVVLAESYNDPFSTKVNTYANGSLARIDVSNMSISGAQVWLWLSEFGGATIEATDAYYAGPFAVNDVIAPVTSYANMTAAGQTYWVGNNSIVGPIPSSLVTPRGITYYIKITDVSPSTPAASIPSSDVAVSVNRWKPYETIKIVPTSGPAGIQIAVTGIAFVAGKLLNVTFSTSDTDTTAIQAGLISIPTNGTFSTTFFAPDLKSTISSNDPRYVNVYYNGTTAILDSKVFTENGRRWMQIGSELGPQPNDWAVPGTVGVFQNIYVSGNFFNPRGPVTLYWDYGTTAQATLKADVSVNGTGFFNASVTVPISALGPHKLTAVDYSFNFNATVVVGTTLKLVPDHGPAGTPVTANGYGYVAGENVTIVWDGNNPDLYGHVLGNVIAGSLGSFSFNFTAHSDWGSVLVYGAGNASSYAEDYFMIEPTLVVSPNVINNDCSIVTVTGSGFLPPDSYPIWYEYSYEEPYAFGYLFYIDNSLYASLNEWFAANSSGYIVFEFVAAGFRPGLHCVSTIEADANPPYNVIARSCFTVTTVGDPILTGINASILAVNGTIVNAINAQLVSIKNDTATIRTATGTILTNVNTISATITTVRGDLVTIASSLGQLTVKAEDINAAVTSVKGDVATVKTDLGTLSGKVVSIQGDTATVKTSLGEIRAMVEPKALEASVSALTLPLWIAVILALVAAIAAVAAVVQITRKIAG